MLRQLTLLSVVAALPAIGISYAFNGQQLLMKATTSLSSLLPPTLRANLDLFASGGPDVEAQMDGRIQSEGLLSSRFGMYGWPGQTFDYVVVGGGTAGLAIARRLSEDGTHSVAVIEAGGFYEIDGGNATEVPMYLFNYFLDNGYTKNPLFDWYQYTEPQPVGRPLVRYAEESQCAKTSVKGLANRSMFYMSGKTLGGSSARGAMLYHRYA